MKKAKPLVFFGITALLLLYVFEEAPSLNPLYLEGALLWAIIITVYVGLPTLLKVGSFTIESSGSVVGPFHLSYSAKSKFPRLQLAIVMIPWILIMATIVISSVLFQWRAYRNQLGEPEIKKFDNEVQAIDVSQIPIVDEDLALRLAAKKLGERPALGSQVSLYDATIQMVDGELVWAVPLHHSGFFKWLTNLSGTPGYIVVSATNTNDVRYVEGYKIKYHPGSYLLFDITRKVRFGPALFNGITDYSFELDDNGQPYWVISTYRNTRGFHLPEATGVILLNATTGEMQHYPLGQVPEWVDRVQPEDFVIQQISNRGNYVHGIFNFANKDKFRASEGHNIVYNNGRCYLFTGLTSVGSDDSAIGFIMVDMVTKEPIMYEMSGATEQAAQLSAQGRVQDLGYQATFPIILNIDSQPTYFMTLKDNIGLIKQYAFVSVANYSTVGTGESVSAALRDYGNKLRSDGVTTIGNLREDNLSTEGTVLRIASEYSGGNTIYKFLLKEEPNILFIAESTTGVELALTQPDDQVVVHYALSTDGTASVSLFDNLEFTQKSAS